ncbi:DUF1206 domain-containing protein [Sphingorhabdus sp.]|uniref:DUF1206 domain-containing protein n=1 Tax=Sphingorhabdus sp. TaxID=1902408 RepID=UPI003918FD21
MVDASARLVTLTRAGFATRGVLYLVIAYFVITSGRTEDPAGALQYVGQGGGRILLLLMAAGLFGYGLWRLTDAIFNIEGHDKDRSGIGARLGAAASGVIHLLLAWQAIKFSQGASASSSSSPQENAQSMLTMPGGGTMLIVVGLVLLIVGGFQIVKAVKADFLKHLEPEVASEIWVKWSGRFGYAARGVIFLITSYFFVAAGLSEQASKAGGMAEALRWLTSPWDMIVAAGLLAFGFFSLIEARYRIIHRVPV